MKLLGEFNQQLESLGELRYAWFTSFNINIEFIESYLLPSVLDMDPPKNRLDYEHFQLVLNDKKIDFRVFCDLRFMETDQNKRTSIPVHGVSTTRLDDFSKESKFHPKIIYLEDLHGKRILGCGSANLTLSGWGRNQEVFTFREIKTKEQYNSVKQFFDVVAKNVGIEGRLPRRRNLPTEGQAWSFVHSFQDETFLDKLFEDTRSHDLMVWSPYLPTDLAKFVTKLKKEVELEDLQIHLVPDRIQGQYIRTAWNDELKTLVDEKTLHFYDNPTTRHENVELCHAKVWKLGSKLAIGSWNFTTPGSNMYSNSDKWDVNSNIEAGFIMQEPSSWQQAVGKPISMRADNFASPELLEDESLQVPEILPFDIQVSFDWKKQHYTFVGNWNEGTITDGYTLKIPDLSKQILLQWRPNKRELNVRPRVLRVTKELLTERRFEVFYHGKPVQRGLITETNFNYRRSQGFESLTDLLDAFVFDGEPGPNDTIPFLPEIGGDGEFDDEVDEDVSIIMAEPGDDISYFRLFQATQQYAETIGSIKSVDELNRYVFTKPGCLLELLEKTSIRLQEPKPSMFNWFLTNEVQALCKLAKKKRKSIGKDEHSLPKARWDMINIERAALPENVDIKDGYVEMVARECNYATD